MANERLKAQLKKYFDEKVWNKYETYGTESESVLDLCKNHFSLGTMFSPCSPALRFVVEKSPLCCF